MCRRDAIARPNHSDVNLYRQAVPQTVPADGKIRKIADTVVDVVEERIGTGEEVAGRSETLDEHGAVRAMGVLAYCVSGTLAGGAQTF